MYLPLYLMVQKLMVPLAPEEYVFEIYSIPFLAGLSFNAL